MVTRRHNVTAWIHANYVNKNTKFGSRYTFFHSGIYLELLPVMNRAFPSVSICGIIPCSVNIEVCLIIKDLLHARLSFYLQQYTVATQWQFADTYCAAEVPWFTYRSVFGIYPLAFVVDLAPEEAYLTHRGRDKIDAILQAALSKLFSCMKMYEFRLRFHRRSFPTIQWTVFHHWFR